MTPEECIARGIAPVKPEFLKPPPAAPAAVADAVAAAPAGGERKPSKREQKRVLAARRGAQLCRAFVAGRCAFSAETCRWSHDEAAAVAAKRPDLPGHCPFACTGEPCRYTVLCRYAGAHAAAAGAAGAEAAPLQGAALAAAACACAAGEPLPLPRVAAVEAERNPLPRELGNALRRNLVPFPAADAQLTHLGLKISFKPAAEYKASLAGDAAPQAEAPTAAADEAPAKRQRTDGEGDAVDGALAGRLRPGERRLVDFSRKLYLAPLTTVGNLPFRRVCKALGADVTCSEMALATNLLQGQPSEWALLRRHASEDCFGVQLCGGFPDALARTAELVAAHIDCDFVDINMGCPIDLVCSKGGGSMLMCKPARIESICRAVGPLLHCPLTVKMRTGYSDAAEQRNAHLLAPQLSGWGVSALTLHGRTRAQRYTRTADWDYVSRVAQAVEPTPLQLIGNGDVMCWADYEEHVSNGGVKTCMLARGALVKPWLFTEIKERRDWDISSGERFALLQRFASHGLEHWGSDDKGVEATRRFLLEWLSFLHRYIPIGLLERLPQRLNMQPPAFVGRDDLETLMASTSGDDWVRLTTMLLGPTPPGFRFEPKHKSNANANNSEAGAALYDANTNG